MDTATRSSQPGGGTVTETLIFVSLPGSEEILFANKAFYACFGPDCLGKSADALLRFAPAHAGGVRSLGISEITAAGADGKKTEAPRHVEGRLEDSDQLLHITRERTLWVDGRPAYLTSCSGGDGKNPFTGEYRDLAFVDYLTGLPNRFRCDADFKSCTGTEGPDSPAYVLFIDLDDFKLVNDTYGHDYGDGVLIAFAGYLQDLFGGNNRVYRFGGDEFVVMISRSAAWKLPYYLESLHERGTFPWHSKGKDFYCSLSIGVVECSALEDAQVLLQKADMAMYSAKKSGKSGFALYSDSLAVEIQQRSRMEALLRHSCENNFQGFKVLFQPYCFSADGSIAGAETLIRMLAPDGSLILPRQFIPLAEYLGIIAPLGEWVLREAARECVRVNNSGRPDFSVIIKISSKQFHKAGVVPHLQSVVRETGVNAANLILGINESVVIDEPELLTRLSRELRALGTRIALDKFGSGNFAIMNMRNLPVDIIKVSPTFIDNYSDSFSEHFLKLSTELAHLAGKEISINGVENQEQFDFCKSLGVDLIQGFHLYLPAPAETLEELLAL